MKKLTLPGLLLLLLLPFLGNSQCTTTNATSCVCESSGASNCDLLPDIIVGKPPLLASGTYGNIEYSQSGNGANDGRLRISVSSPNIGHGPLEVRTTNRYICGTDTITGTAPTTCPTTGLPPKQLVVQRVYHKNGGTMTYIDRNAGSMTYHPSHGHMHVDDWGLYSLRQQTSDPNPLNWPIIGNGAKLAFCLMDYGSCSTYSGHCVDANNNTLLNGNFPNYGLGGGAYNCSPTVQGISSGYTDIYYQSLDGMWINIPPGTCNGNYFIVIQLDPYNYFMEENENNNLLVVPYTLTLQSPGAVATITPSTTAPQCIGSTITLNANSGLGNTYLWSNGATTQSINVTTPGSYVVTVNSLSCGSAVSSAYNVSFTGTTPVTAGASVCGSGSANLGATANGATINWYSAASGGGSIGTGTSFTTPPLSTTTTYFAEATTTTLGYSSYALPTANTIGTGGYFTGSQYQIFDVLQTLNLASVKVYASAAASTTVELRNSAGTLLNSKVASIPAGESRITLNWSIPAGSDYRLTRSGTTSLYRNSAGVAYPYTIPNYLSIKNSSAGTANYYFFYDWEISIPGQTCVSARVPATLTVNPLPTVNISGTNNICNGASTVLTASGANSYSWSPSTGLNTTNGSSVNASPASTTTYTVVGTGAAGCTSSQDVTVTVNSLPVVSASSNTDVCAGSSAALTASGASTYLWSPATGLSTTTGSSVNASPASTTTYTVVGTNAAGCTASQTVTVTVNPLPAVTASSNTAVCAGSSAALTASGASTYLWSPATGLNTTTGSGVNASPASTTTYTVVGTNAAGCTASQNVTVTVNPLLAVTLAAFTAVCNNAASFTLTGGTPTGGTYSGLGVSAGSFSPATAGIGTHTISYSYTDANGCSNSTSNTITVNNCNCVTPGTPGSIAGAASVCAGSTVTYSVNYNTYVTSYNWVAPSNATIISGQGTNIVAVQFGANYTTGSLCVAAANACGSSLPRCKTLTKTATRTPGNILGQLYGNCDAVVNLSVAAVAGASSYTWTLPAGTTLLSGQGTNAVSFTTPAGFVSGSVCVTAFNGCVNSTARCATIYGAPAKPVISGPATVCANQTNLTYSVPAAYGATTYTWAVPAGSTIVSGQGTNSIVVNFGTTAGKVNVIAKNACGNRGTSTYSVAINCRISGIENLGVYPNPATTNVEIVFNAADKGNADIQLMDITGRVVYTNSIETMEGRNQIQLDLNGYSKGVYMLNVNKNNTISRIKLVIE